jgi:hypothetical protein
MAGVDLVLDLDVGVDFDTPVFATQATHSNNGRNKQPSFADRRTVHIDVQSRSTSTQNGRWQI